MAYRYGKSSSKSLSARKTPARKPARKRKRRKKRVVKRPAAKKSTHRKKTARGRKGKYGGKRRRVARPSVSGRWGSSWFTPSWWPSASTPAPRRGRRKKAAVVDVPLRCAFCGDLGDHGGDGHPFETDDEAEERRRALRERWGLQKMKPKLAFRETEAPVTGMMTEQRSRLRYEE